MKTHRLLMRLVLVVAVLSWGIIQLPAQSQNSNGMAQGKGQMRSTTQAQRKAARARQAPQKKGVAVTFAGVNPTTAALSPLAPLGAGPTALAAMAVPNSPPDYFAVANWANSPLPTVVGFGATATATFGGVSGSVALTLTAGGDGYTADPTVSISPPNCVLNTTNCIAATATAAVAVTPGPVTSLTLTNPGAGYTTDPFVTITGSIDFTTGMRKFVDGLPDLKAVIATADTQTFPGSDYYEISLVDYTQVMHSDLPLGTKLRGYVQTNMGTHSPSYLGPVILAQKDRPVRVTFTNALPAGNGGNLFIPTDTTYMGAGMGPDGTPYSQNRATLHLHGGNTPWISDGTPHQWTVPALETGTSFKKGVSVAYVPDMWFDANGAVIASCSGQLTCGVTGASNNPGPGKLTFYWTNHQGGRLMFYHDHAYGITRLNVYAGEAAGYLLVDPVEENALAGATVPGTVGTTPDLAHLIPLVIQDKTFVPDNGTAGGQLAAQDPTWDLPNWGGKGNLWFPHVYMPNQNPADLSGANAYGRWDYGAWFHPAQNPATYVSQPYQCTSAAYSTTNPPAFPPLMCPGTPLPSGTPEGFMDTPVINGMAYPFLTVAPAAYRFQILAAGNDRTWNFGLYYALDRVTGAVCKAGTGATFSPANCTEVSMVPALPHTPTSNPPLCAAATATSIGGQQAIAALDGGGNPLNGTGLPAGCWPTTWPTDARDGGVPDPLTAGPPFIVIGSEGGVLPTPAAIPSTPNGYEYNRRSITVLNVFTHGLMLGPAERADAVVDFSGVPAGSVLMLYNDAPAPVPAFDPRNDYYTGDPDQTSTGGAPTTEPGYGPNTRTIMQIQVTGANNNTTPFKLGTLTTNLPSIFATSQPTPIVAQPTYPPTSGGNATNATYVRIQDNFITAFIGGPIGVSLTSGGAGYTAAPSVLIADPVCTPGPACVTATASATLAPTTVGGVALNNGGSGYTSAPTVTFSGGGGTGAAATATLTPRSVGSVTVTSRGNGYTSVPTVTFTAPQTTGGTTAAGTAVVVNRRVTAINITNAGTGYTAAPTINITGGGGSGAAATATLGPGAVGGVTLTNGGSGYTSTPTVGFSGGGGSAAAATATLTPTVVASITLTNGGNGYRSAPVVTISGPQTAGSPATAVATAPVSPLLDKTIQELFTLDYGRMNATLGVELPFTNFLTQTTIPYGYIDPPTEIFKDGEIQFWKVTHNGVDTHFIHFHLFNVQLINRIGWDGAIKPPDPNELGWKDTVRMNPLETVVVALQPMRQTLPFDLPNSIRPMDVTRPTTSTAGFTNIDPVNQPAAVKNDLVNFGWEYVWHCHILGHEENDMMRAMVLAIAPISPSGPVATRLGTGNGQSVALTWADNSLNETGFTVQRSTNGGAFTNVGTVGPNVTTFTDATVARRTSYSYRVIANNMVGYTQSYAAPAVGYPHTSADSTPSAASNTVTTN